MARGFWGGWHEGYEIATSGFDVYAAVNLWPWLEELYGPVPNASNHLSYKERSKIYEAAGRYVEQ